MRTPLLPILMLSIALVAQGFDWKDYDVEHWWLEIGTTAIAQAMCLLYSNLQRPSASIIPENTTAMNGTTVIPLARHHIIPGNTLMDFFNTAIRENGAGNLELGGLLQTLGYLADNFLEYYAGNTQVDDDVRTHLQNIRTTQLRLEEGNDVPLEDLFDANQVARSIFYWMPFNLFMGPQNRQNDAGSSFEINAAVIVRNDGTFEMLRRLFNMMNLYIQFRQQDQFRMAIGLLQELIVRGRHEPYPFNVNQWTYAYTNNNGVIFYDFNPNTIATTPAARSKRHNIMTRDNQDQSYVKKDPLCILPIASYAIDLRKNNLMIAANIIDRVQKGQGFKQENYDSWKAWLESYSWEDTFFQYGLTNHANSMVNNKRGHIFKDKSFAVGFTVADFRFGNDSWMNMPSWSDGVAGQMFFDKNWRPVALAVSDNVKTSENKGWLFVYTRRQMFLPFQNSLDPVSDIPATISLAFPEGRTESYSSTAMTFEPKKIIANSHDPSEYKKK